MAIGLFTARDGIRALGYVRSAAPDEQLLPQKTGSGPMSSAYLITLLERLTSLEYKPEIVITPEYFANQLAAKWLGTVIRMAPEEAAYTLYWELNPGDIATPHGGFKPKPMTVAIHGGAFDPMVEFIIWFRSIVPEEHKLVMMITSFNWEPLELDSNTKASDIIRHISG